MVGIDRLHPQGFRGLALVFGIHPEDGAVALPARGDGRDGGDVDACVREFFENRHKRPGAIRALDEKGLFPGAELELRLAREGGEGPRSSGTKSTWTRLRTGKACIASRLTPASLKREARAAPSPGLLEAVM